jgi:hypothetical protein
MALIVSAASGNFNAGATWVGGVVPTVGDEGRAATGHTITITANATCTEISNDGTGTFVLNSGVTLTANVNSRSNVTLLNFNAASPNSASIVGNITNNNTGGGLLVAGIRNSSTGTLNITGNCSVGASSNTTPAVLNNLGGIVNITGNVTAGGGSNSFSVNNVGAGTVNITGNVTASAVSGAFQGSTGTLSVIGTVTASQNAAGVAGSNVLQQTILSGPFITETTRGVAPVYCAAWRWNASPSNSTYMEVMTNNLLAKRNLVTADNITGMPAASDVKSGIAYGPSNELTGTFAQTVTPSTADIATAVWGAATRTITGGVVDTLTNSPDVPTEAEIASQVRTELSVELGRIDAAISSRLAPSGTLATVTTLTNAPTVPTAAAIADEVRVELATELARIDAPISGAGNAPSAATVATAVRTELATELARVDAAVSTRLAGSAYTAPANSDISAIKSKTDALPASPAATGDIPTAAQNATAVWSKPANELTVADSIGERAKQQSTVAITGAQLAAALS